MARAAKICSNPHCPNLQPCPEHERKSWAGSTRSKRLPRDWQRRRGRVLARSSVCAICNQAPATEVDHIEPGDDHRMSNLQGVCTDCHKRKSAAEGNEARRSR